MTATAMPRGVLELPESRIWKHCDFCGRKITDAQDAHLEIFSCDADGVLQYPSRGDHIVALLAHGECGPECCYHIGIDRIGQEGEEMWQHHLANKPWWSLPVTVGVRECAALAVALRRKAEPQRPAFANIPTRPPRAPSDPRNIKPAMRAFVLERDNFLCRRCGHGTTDGVKLVVDHIIPVAKGGTGDPSNLQTLCFECNAGKTDRDPHQHDQRAR